MWQRVNFFLLDEDEQSKVCLLEPSGILHIESQLRLDDYRTYNRFVDSYKRKKRYSRTSEGEIP